MNNYTTSAKATALTYQKLQEAYEMILANPEPVLKAIIITRKIPAISYAVKLRMDGVIYALVHPSTWETWIPHFEQKVDPVNRWAPSLAGIPILEDDELVLKIFEAQIRTIVPFPLLFDPGKVMESDYQWVEVEKPEEEEEEEEEKKDDG